MPKETGRAGRVQNSRAAYALNRAYADNDNQCAEMSEGDMYGGGDDNPMHAKRARAAASNSRVMAMVEAARAKRNAVAFKN